MYFQFFYFHTYVFKEYFSVDSRRRLWTLSSVRAKEIPSDDFYVPNLLPKSTPVKTKKPMNQDNGNNKLVDDMNRNESRDVHLGERFFFRHDAQFN